MRVAKRPVALVFIMLLMSGISSVAEEPNAEIPFDGPGKLATVWGSGKDTRLGAKRLVIKDLFCQEVKSSGLLLPGL